MLIEQQILYHLKAVFGDALVWWNLVSMKKNYVAIKEEDVKALKTLISETEKRTLDYEFVLREIRKSLKAADGKLAATIDANWKRFLELHALQMPHVVYNGHAKPTIVDWVKDPENKFKLEKAVKAYRYTEDDEQTIVSGCFEGRIVRTKQEKEMETITFASGFQKEMPSLDEEGNPIVNDVDVTLVPKEKSTWGFTSVMVEAFIAATDDLLAELAK